MFQLRDNKPMRLTSHKAVAVVVRTSLAARMTRTMGLVIVAGWKKEAAP
jgi:hypothetical protein